MAKKQAEFPRTKLFSLAAGFLLLAAALLTARAHFYFEPQDTDTYFFASAAHEALQGRALYSDLWDVKPPAAFATYALAEKICGYGLSEIFFLNVLFSLWILAALLSAGKLLSGSVWTALAAGLFWALASGSLPLQANQPSCELFINAFQVLAFLLFASLSPDKKNASAALAAGFCLGLASLYKPVPVVLLVGFCGALFLLSKSPSQKKNARVHVLAAILGFASVWALTFLYFGVTGRFLIFLQAVFLQNVEQLSWADNLWTGLFSPAFWPAKLSIFIVLALPAFYGLARGWAEKGPRWILLSAYLAAVPLEISIRGTFFPHYYQLWLPPLCVGAAWGLERLWRESGKFFAVGLTAFCLIVLATLNWHWLGFSPQEAALESGFEIEAPAMGGLIRQTLLPGEDYYEWTQNLRFAMMANRRLAAGAARGEFLFTPPMGESLSQRTLTQLKAAQPELLVFDENFDPGTPDWKLNPVYRYLMENYVPYLEVEKGHYLFCWRKGGALEKRLGKGFKKPDLPWGS